MKEKNIVGDIITGKYILESKRRFSCEVEINGQVEKCYVASSAKLEQFIELKNKNVKLYKNNENSKFKYTLWTVSCNGSDIILDLKKVNRIVAELIKHKNLLNSNYIEIKEEKKIESLKSDLILISEDSIEILEIKSIISCNKEAIFPSVGGDRAIEQLVKIERILRDGKYKVKYIIVALSPNIEKIIVNPENIVYKTIFEKCIALGMEVIKINLKCCNGKINYKYI